MKICSHCKNTKPRTEFPKNAAMPDGLNNYCRPCKAESDRKYVQKHADKLRDWKNVWQRDNNDKRREYSEKYEKTQRGFLVRCYRNMKSRIDGVQKNKHYLYAGKALLPKDEFYLWSLSNADFVRLFSEWKRSGYERRLAPSPDRIDSAVGYTIANIQWVTMSANSARSHVNRICA